MTEILERDSVTTEPHASGASEVLARLGVDPERGIRSDEVQARRAAQGANRLPEAPARSPVLLFLDQFNNPLIYILLAAAGATAIIADVAEATTILAVVLFNAILGFVQEHRASVRLRSVLAMTAPSARVVRDGAVASIPAEEVVVGDIVLLESGARVPADLRLVTTNELLVGESVLTGEAVPVEKSAGARLDPSTALGDRRTMAYAGTTVARGRGRGVVTAVGAATEMGKIAGDLAGAETVASPLQEKLGQFGRRITVAIGVVITLIVVVGMLRGYPPVEMIMTAIGLAVSAIPEGLPIAVTVALSIGIHHMARRRAIVRRLPAVETLGSTTIVCSDKTGTLTRNEMTVVAITTPVPGSDDAREWTLRVGELCSETVVRADESGRTIVDGDPTEGALMVAARRAGLAQEGWRSEVLVPFESERMYMVSIAHHASGRWLMVKGSFDRVAALCSRQIGAAGLEPFDEVRMRREEGSTQARGLRVLAMAYRRLDEGEAFDAENPTSMVFAGMQGIEDPPREEAIAAVGAAQQAGMRVVMITGDHATTAVAIARQLGINGGRDPRVLTGAQLEALTDTELAAVVDTTDVYARVAPAHKLRIVRLLQGKRHVVAMTGDGVNDAPALKQADIGIAMGSGTDVTKEAGDLVVQDDSFATIIEAVRYGRVLFGNLRRMVLYVLSTSAGGVLTLVASVALGLPLPMLAVQLLWINLVTDGTSTIPLAYEKGSADVMQRPPRRRDDGLLSRAMLERILMGAVVMATLTLVVFELVLMGHGFSTFSSAIPEAALLHARTAAFTTLALLQIWNVHNCRSLDRSIFSIGLLSNRPLAAVTLLALALQVAAVELPLLNTLLKTAPLSIGDWMLSLGMSLLLVVVVELRKLVGRRRASHE